MRNGNGLYITNMFMIRLFSIIIGIPGLVLQVKCEDDQGFVYTSYQTSMQCRASSPIRYPRNVRQLRSIINSAIASNRTVKLIGSQHSVTDIICTDGIPVNIRNINYTRLSPNGKTVTVGAGAQLLDALDILHEQGRTIIGVPVYGGISIGGATGTGAHGSSLQHPSTLSDQMVGVTLIDGLGRLRKITRKNEDLPAFRVHLGLLGAIVDVTFKTVPSFKATIVNYLDLESVLFDGTALREAQLFPWYQLWWFPYSKTVVISKGNYSSPEESEELPGDAHTNLVPNISPLIIATFSKALEDAQAARNLKWQLTFEELAKESFYTQVMAKPPIFTEEVVNGSERFVNPATGWAYRLQTNRCNDTCPWDNGAESLLFDDYAMGFNLDQFQSAFSRMREILSKTPAAFPLAGILIRFSKASDGLMSVATGRDTVLVEWVLPMRFDRYNHPKDRLGVYQAMQQSLLYEFDGRPHWGKNGPIYSSRRMLRRRPRQLVRKFRRAMRKYDPNGLFLNRFGRRVISKSGELTVDPSTKHCALMDNCLCGQNEDCADFQVCSKFEGRYPVCRNKIDNELIPKDGRFSMNLQVSISNSVLTVSANQTLIDT